MFICRRGTRKMTKMMRITQVTADNLTQLAEMSGMSKQSILERAVDAFLRDQFLKKANEDYARIKADPELWALELKEREEWDATLMDGLEDE